MLNQEEQIIIRKAFARLNQGVDAVIKKAHENKQLNIYGKAYKKEYVRKVMTGKKDDLQLEILVMEVCKQEIEKKGLLVKKKQAIAQELKDVPLVVNNHKNAFHENRAN